MTSPPAYVTWCPNMEIQTPPISIYLDCLTSFHISAFSGVNSEEEQEALLKFAIENEAKYAEYRNDCHRKIEELNATLPDEENFFCVSCVPRAPDPEWFFPYYREYEMSNTNPTSLKSKRFTNPGAHEYRAEEIMQIMSLRFSGDFLHDQPMSIYGFLAVRDNVDCCRNYVFNHSREHALQIRPESRILPLISPVRAISARYGVMVEYSIRVKNDGKDGTDEDHDLIDGCFQFDLFPRDPNILNMKSRIFGPHGSVDIKYLILRKAIEASVDVSIKRAVKGYRLKAVTAFSSGYQEDFVLYKSSHAAESNDGSASSASVVLTSSVVAVSLGAELKLKLDVKVPESRGVKRTIRYELPFKVYKYGTCSRTFAIGCGRPFELVADVTWSTLGQHE